MKRLLLVPVAALGLVLTAVLLVAALSGRVEHDPVYLPDALREQLASNPVSWAGRTVLVRGTIVPCRAYAGSRRSPPCLAWPALGPAWRVGAGVVGEEFLVGRADPDLVPEWLGQVPLLGLVEPAPQVLRWGAAATYRVRITRLDPMICSTGLCYELLLREAVL